MVSSLYIIYHKINDVRKLCDVGGNMHQTDYPDNG